jgi:L-ribulose-5-phosphate 3-epimerase
VTERQEGLMVEYIASTYTYLWRADIDSALAGIAEAGFSQVELLAAPPHVDAAETQLAAEQITAACRRTGVSVHSVVPSGVDVNLASADSTMREWSVGYFTMIGRLAASVGARWLITHPGRRHPLRPAPYDQCRQWATDGLSLIVDALSDAEIGILFENTPTGILDTGEECAQLVQRIGPDVLGVCYDVANGHMVEDAADGLRAAGPHLGLVHLSDTTRAAWAHDPIGKGELDFRGIAEALSALEYRAEVVLETLHGDDPVAGLTADVAALREAGWR